jgi:hypothetical protein
MEGVLRQDEMALGIEEVGVGQVDVQHHVVGLHGRGERHRPVAFERELQAREKARVVVEEARRAVLDLVDVAELVEHCEAVAMLERATARRGERDDARNDDRARGRPLGLHSAATARRRPSAR